MQQPVATLPGILVSVFDPVHGTVLCMVPCTTVFYPVQYVQASEQSAPMGAPHPAVYPDAGSEGVCAAAPGGDQAELEIYSGSAPMGGDSSFDEFVAKTLANENNDAEAYEIFEQDRANEARGMAHVAAIDDLLEAYTVANTKHKELRIEGYMPPEEIRRVRREYLQLFEQLLVSKDEYNTRYPENQMTLKDLADIKWPKYDHTGWDKKIMAIYARERRAAKV